MTERPPQPEPMVCPACSDATEWIWDDDVLPNDPPDRIPQPEWVIDGEWWHDDDAGVDYADSHHCLVKLTALASAP